MSSSPFAWAPGADFLERSNVTRFLAALGIPSYDELSRRWREDPAWFWGEAARYLGVCWYEEPRQTLDLSRGAAWPAWFPGGVTNLVETCLERHDPYRLALVWEGEEGATRRLTYGDLRSLVSAIAGGLAERGVGLGDRVGLYMPLTPESVACLYACAKLGAIVVPMFSGFGADAVAGRLRDAEAKVLVTADGFHRRGRAVDMRSTALEAAKAAPSVEDVIVWPRLAGGDAEALLGGEPVERPLPLDAGAPFMIAYTSGTTGRPKGAVHTHGGFPLKVATEIAFHCDQRDGELLFWLTDPGWIMAPLTALGAGFCGQPLLLYDGAPDHPTAGRVAELVRRHGARILGVSPTYVRALMRREDHGFDDGAPSLRVLGSTGEPWNEGPWSWFFRRVGGGRCPIVNVAGGTEAGSLLGVVPIRPLRPCSFNSSAIGMDIDVVDASGASCPPGDVGELVVRQPWPGQTKGFWRDPQRYLETYWSRWPGVWVHGDWASRDADGLWYLHGRSDDTIMVAGKRVGPAEIESALVEHPKVIEAAAVGIPDELKGEQIWCFVVAAAAFEESELRGVVAESLGKSFAPARVISVPALPRTRNAKILRRAIRATVTGQSPGDLSSLENPDALDAIAAACS